MRTLFLLFFVVVLFGCSSRLDHGQDEQGDRQALTLRALLDDRGDSTATSKAPFLSTPDGAFPNGTYLFGIIQMSNDLSVAYATGSENVWAENVVFAGFEAWNFKPVGASTGTRELPPLYVGRAMRVSAYYPYQSGRTYNPTLETVPLTFDLTAAAEQNDQTDLLYCPEVMLEANGYASRELTLSFRHFYALLEFQIKLDRVNDIASKITKVAVMNKTGKDYLKPAGLYCSRRGSMVSFTPGNPLTIGVVLNTSVDLTTEYATIQVMVPPVVLSSAYVTGDMYVQFYDNDVALTDPFLIKQAHMSAGTFGYVGGLKYAYRLKYSKIGSGTLTQVPWGSGGATGDLGTEMGSGLVQISAWSSVAVEGVFGTDIPMLQYGVAPHGITTGLSGSSDASYNSWKGTVAAPAVDGGNGAYRASTAGAYSDEPPYFRFEVALADETETYTWQAARAACWAKTLDGGGWRLPRLSELRLMYLNKASLEATANFTAFNLSGSAVYRSATEIDLSSAGTIQLSTGATGTNTVKTNPENVRCVREVLIPPTVANPPAASDYVTIDGLKWAKGNLVAVNASNAKVGAATDYGLYFHFGSLVGWSGGATGSGVGTGSPALAVQVKPAGYTGSVVWPAGRYTGGTVAGTGYGLPATDVAATGIGDPCRLYLGAPWRTPTAAEYSALFAGSIAGMPWSKLADWAWQATPAGAMGPQSLFFPASGQRNKGDGLTSGLTKYGYSWSSSVYDATNGYYLYLYSSYVFPQGDDNRSSGYPVRCVSN